MLKSFAYSAVDTIQDSKKQFVKTFVPHEALQSALNGFVDAQRAYTKSAIDAGINTMVSVGSLIASKAFYDDLAKQFKKGK